MGEPRGAAAATAGVLNEKGRGQDPRPLFSWKRSQDDLLCIDSGDDLLSRFWHYHRFRRLNGRVRNGNGCGPPGVVTGKLMFE